MKWVTLGETAMPDIAALVRERLENGSEFKVDHDPADIGNSILRQLKEKRGEHKKGLSSLRLSASGSCIRRLAYDFHGVEPDGFKTTSSSTLIFGTGDATEGLLVTALLEAIADVDGISLEATGADQQRIHVKVPLRGDLSDALGKPWAGVPIPGHPDGQGVVPVWDKGDDEPHLEPFILEVKSMSDYAFSKFRKEGIPFYESNGVPNGYAFQSQAYQLAKRQEGIPVRWTYLIAYGKSVGAKDAMVFSDAPPKSRRWHEDDPDQWANLYPVIGAWIPRNDEVQAEIISRYQQVLLSEGPDDFDRPHGPKRDTGHPGTKNKYKGAKRSRLTFPCDWCPHLFNCWPEAFTYAQTYGFYKELCSIHTAVPKED